MSLPTVIAIWIEGDNDRLISVMANYFDKLLDITLTFLGFVVMITPLALWVAWSVTVMLVVLGAFVGAAVLYCILIYFEKPAASGPVKHSDNAQLPHSPAQLLHRKIMFGLQKLLS